MLPYVTLMGINSGRSPTQPRGGTLTKIIKKKLGINSREDDKRNEKNLRERGKKEGKGEKIERNLLMLCPCFL